MKLDSTRYWIALVTILMLAWAFRLSGIADRNVWWDEGWTIWVIRQDVSQINRITATDVHPPLYFWGLHTWWRIVGEGEFLLRFPSAVFGTLGVAAIFGLGSALGGRRTGLLAALFLTCSRFLITWSQEMRMYTVAAFFATVALWAAIRCWRTESRRAWLIYVLMMAAGLWTVYLYVSVWLVVNLGWLAVWWRASDKRRRLLGWATAQAAVLAFYLPWLAFALPRLPTRSAAEPVSLVSFIRIYATILATGVPVAIENYAPWVLLVILILIAGLTTLWFKKRPRAKSDTVSRAALIALVSGLLLPAFIVYAISLPIDFFYTPRLEPRYLLVLSSCFYLLLAWGIIAFSHRKRWLGWLSAGLVLTAALNGLIGFYPGRLRSDDYKSLGMTLEAYAHARDAVVLQDDTDWPVFAAYYPRYWHGVPSRRSVDPASVQEFLEPVWDGSEGVWLVKTAYARQSDPEGRIEDWLADRALAQRTSRYAQSELLFFARTPERAATVEELALGHIPSYGLDVEMESGVHIVGAEIALPAYRVGDTVHLFLYWQAVGAANDASSAPIELALVDERERTVKTAAINTPGGSGLQRQQIDLPLTTAHTPGRHVIRLDGHPIASFYLADAHTPASDALVSIELPLRIRFADPAAGSSDASIHLLGYDLEKREIRPGESLQLTLYWSTSAPLAARYKVFTQLQGDQINPATGTILWGQHDAEPDNFTRPMTTWVPGNTVIDPHSIPVDDGTPPGRYRIAVGLYDGLTGARLAVYDEAGSYLGDQLVLEQITAP